MIKTAIWEKIVKYFVQYYTVERLLNWKKKNIVFGKWKISYLEDIKTLALKF